MSKILENDKYIFAAITNEKLTTCGVVQIFEKSSIFAENLDKKILFMSRFALGY